MQFLKAAWPLEHITAGCLIPRHNPHGPNSTVTLPGSGLSLLKQVHGAVAVQADAAAGRPKADACWTTSANQVCAIQTADCLPLLCYQQDSAAIAAIHAGWRGLSKNIITRTLQQLPGDKRNCHVWIGPCICARHYEVSTNWIAQRQRESSLWHDAWQADKGTVNLSQVAKRQLERQGISHIYDSGLCTWHDDLPSYRRDADKTRILSLIWRHQ